MLNTAIVGLGWWGQTLVKAAGDFGAPLRFTRGVTLEPDPVAGFRRATVISSSGLVRRGAGRSRHPGGGAGDAAYPRIRAQVDRGGRRGKHIYCEKPFALSKADASAMLEAVERAGVTIAVGHHFRLMPSMRALAELKAKGAFGTIMHVEGNYSHDWLASYPADSWRMAREESRAGGMTGMGIHVLDCFRDLNGPMKRISALSKARVLKIFRPATPRPR